jgi:hypothetical protein
MAGELQWRGGMEASEDREHRARMARMEGVANEADALIRGAREVSDSMASAKRSRSAKFLFRKYFEGA